MTDQSWYVDHPEKIVVTTKKIACDGGGGALGHPKVWYDMAEKTGSNANTATVCTS